MASRRDVLKAGVGAVGAGILTGPGIDAAASSDYGIRGRLAPELEIDYWIDENGEPTAFSLAEHAGKWIILKCFQSWCPGCHSHGFPALRQMSAALADNPRIVFAGIQTVFEGYFTNTVDKVRELQLRYDLRMPLGHDAGVDDVSPRTMRDYRTGGTPWFIVINPRRQVIFNDYGIDAEQAIAFLESRTG